MTQAQLLSEFSLLPLPQPSEIAQAIVAQQAQIVSQLLNGQSRHKTLAEAAKILVNDIEKMQN